MGITTVRHQNTFANDEDYVLGSSNLVHGKNSKARLRKQIKKQTHKRERKEKIEIE